MADPYQTLGVARGADEADDQEGVSQARQGAASRSQQGQSQGGRALQPGDQRLRPADRQGQARALRPRRDRRRRAIPRRRSASAAEAGAAARCGERLRAQDFDFGGGEAADIERHLRRAVRRRQRGGGGFAGGFGRRPAAAKGAERRLSPRCAVRRRRDAEPAAGARCADGKTIDLKLPRRGRDRHADAAVRQGRARSGRRRRRDRHDRGSAAPLLHPRRRRRPARPADHARRGGAAVRR